jgi:4-hydroxy-tetrahydrodipicolinate synthase
MKSNELHGVIVPVITPVDHEERVDEGAFRKVLRRLIAAGVNGVFVGGSAGEGPLLTMREWERMVRIGFEEVNGKAALLGGVSDTSTRRMTEKIKILQGIGYARYVVTPTFYICLKRPEEHLRLFGAARDAGNGMEMIAYNIPQCVGSVLAVETLVEIAKRGWVRYCKESSGDLAYFKRVLAEAGAAGLKVLMGDEPLIPEGLLAGAVGIVPVCANYDPKLFLRAYAAGVAGKEDELRGIHKTIMSKRATLLLGGACWLSGIKLALSLLGMGTGQPVSPLQPVESKQKMEIEQLVKADQGTL